MKGFGLWQPCSIGHFLILLVCFSFTQCEWKIGVIEREDQYSNCAVPPGIGPLVFMQFTVGLIGRDWRFYISLLHLQKTNLRSQTCVKCTALPFSSITQSCKLKHATRDNLSFIQGDSWPTWRVFPIILSSCNFFMFPTWQTAIMIPACSFTLVAAIKSDTRGNNANSDMQVCHSATCPWQATYTIKMRVKQSVILSYVMDDRRKEGFIFSGG